MENVHFEHLQQLLDNREIKKLRSALDDMNEMDIAEFLGTLPEPKLALVFRMLPKETAAEVFAYLEVEEQEKLINSMTDKELAYIIEELYVDDAVDMLEELPSNVVKRVMQNASGETRSLINRFLNYPENSAGSIMTAEFVDLKQGQTVQQAFDRIRRIGEDKETIYTCYVTSADRQLEGVVTVKELLLAQPDAIIRDIMDDHVIRAVTTDDQEAVSQLFSKYDLLAIPVVDQENRLVGIITVDDVLDVMEQETTEDIEKMAAMLPSDKPYMKLTVWEIWRNRIPWLLLLMVSATFTGMIITSFESALAAQVALTAFIPMLMDTGGNSGSQSSVTVIRSLSLGDLQFRDIFRVLWKEVRVSVLCGASLAVAGFAKVMLIDRLLLGNSDVTALVAAVVALTLIVTVFFAKIVGCTLPMLAKRIGFDPAVMASPFITTIVDAISLLVYFQVAKLLMGI